MICPPHNLLTDFVLNRLDDHQSDEIDNHLIECDSCRQKIAELERTTDDPVDVEIRKAVANNTLEKYIALKTTENPIINGFKIVRKIGQGGMGVVYEAIATETGDIRAIKVLHSSRHFDPASVRRFQKEKEAISRLHHDNIVRSFSCDDPLCIVMERLQGKNLSELSVPLPIDQTLNIIIQAAKGFEYAHANGIVHRDVKPSNIFITTDGTIKILDLGLAKIINSESGSTQTHTSDHIVGTLDFLSPEQILSPNKIGIQSDIYSLGVVFFFLLTGRVPFVGSTGEKLAGHARDKAPDIRKFRQDVSPALTSIVSKMLEKEPNRRFKSMTEVAEAILNPKIANPRLGNNILFGVVPILLFIFSLVCGKSLFLNDKNARGINLAESGVKVVPVVNVENAEPRLEETKRQIEPSPVKPVNKNKRWKEPINSAFSLTIGVTGRVTIEMGQHSDLSNLLPKNDIHFPEFVGYFEIKNISKTTTKYIYSFSNQHQDCQWLSEINNDTNSIKTVQHECLTNGVLYSSFSRGSLKEFDFSDKLSLPLYVEFSLYDWYGDGMSLVFVGAKHRLEFKIKGKGVAKDGKFFLEYELADAEKTVISPQIIEISPYTRKDFVLEQADRPNGQLKLSLRKDEKDGDIRLNYVTIVKEGEEKEANLIKNPSFEEGSDIWRNDWDRMQTAGYADFGTSDDAHDGNVSVTIESKDGGSGVWRQFVPVEPNAQYRFSVWYKLHDVRSATDGNSGMNLIAASGVYTPPSSGSYDNSRWESAPDTLQLVFPKPIRGTTGWKKYEQTIETGPNDTHVFIGLRLGILIGGKWKSARGKAFFDDVSLVKVSP